MRVVWFLLNLVWFIIMLPFALLDYVFIELPKELLANRWRKNVKVGDRAYFINMLGARTYGEVTKIYKSGEVGFKTHNSTGGRNLNALYPAKDGEY